MSAQTQLLHPASLLSGRQMVMLVTIALHALIISVLMAMRVFPNAMQPQSVPLGEPLQLERVAVPPPSAMPVKLQIMRATVPDVIVPDVNFDVPQIADPPVAPAASDSFQMAPVEAGPVVAPQIVSTALQFRAVRSADDYYPAASLNLEEEGVAIVQVCVTPAGNLDGKPTIQTSSGSSRLDAAALTWAREALRFTPATRGGVPISACKGFRVNFTLH